MRVRLEDVLPALVEPVQAALAKFNPDKVTVELNLGLVGGLGVFVAKSEVNASIKVTATWGESKMNPKAGDKDA